MSGKISSDPPVDVFIFWATVTISGNPTDNINAGSYGSTNLSPDGGQGLATFLQTNVFGLSGAGIQFGDNSYAFWVVLESAPTDWTWNDVPIEFTPAAEVVDYCFDTETIVTNPDPSAWVALRVQTDNADFTPQGIVNYGDPGFEAAWAAYAIQIGGLAAQGTATIGATDVVLRIAITPIRLLTHISDNGSIQPSVNYVLCP